MSTIYLEGEVDIFGREPLSPDAKELADFTRLLPRHDYGLRTSVDAATSALSIAIRSELRYARESIAKLKNAKDHLDSYERLCIELDSSITKTAARTSQLIAMLERHQATVLVS